MILAIIMWCACAGVGYLICKPKRREIDGIALGFVLGPVGVIIALLLPVGIPKSAPLTFAEASRLKYNCPRCRRPLLNSRKGRGTCSHCGHHCVGHE